MLPLPGSPSSSWAMYRARLAAIFEGADSRVVVAFWLFGLINNVLYVIILTAALDLVGPTIPKGVVLLCNIIPSLVVKLLCPYFIHLFSYPARVIGLVAISTAGMLLVAITPAYDPANPDSSVMATKMTGVAVAASSSAAGEVTFLSLTHFYGPFSLAGWGSGTGGAGLIGAGAYSLATTAMGLSSRGTLFASAFLPFVMIGSFFAILPLGPLKISRKRENTLESEGRGPDEEEETDALVDHEASDTDEEDQRGRSLLQSSSPTSRTSVRNFKPQPWTPTFRSNLRQIRSLFFPYMLPLLLVYTAEYTINQAVTPTLLYPLPTTPFHTYRSFYPTYATIYQAGVFLSRSSTPFLRLHNLYLPSLLQLLNLALLIAQSLHPALIPSVWIVFGVIFWEGLLGGAVYVNTFAEMGEHVDPEWREWSLGTVSVSDSAGIAVAGVIGVGLERWLCAWQVERLGRGWCREL